jgi:hypothetical protein
VVSGRRYSQYYMDAQISHKRRSLLKIVGARMMTRCKFHADDQQISLFKIWCGGQPGTQDLCTLAAMCTLSILRGDIFCQSEPNCFVNL